MIGKLIQYSSVGVMVSGKLEGFHNENYLVTFKELRKSRV